MRGKRGPSQGRPMSTEHGTPNDEGPTSGRRTVAETGDPATALPVAGDATAGDFPASDSSNASAEEVTLDPKTPTETQRGLIKLERDKFLLGLIAGMICIL